MNREEIETHIEKLRDRALSSKISGAYLLGITAGVDAVSLMASTGAGNKVGDLILGIFNGVVVGGGTLSLMSSASYSREGTSLKTMLIQHDFVDVPIEETSESNTSSSNGSIDI